MWKRTNPRFRLHPSAIAVPRRIPIWRWSFVGPCYGEGKFVFSSVEVWQLVFLPGSGPVEVEVPGLAQPKQAVFLVWVGWEEGFAVAEE
jgi:hypothetical protein